MPNLVDSIPAVFFRPRIVTERFELRGRQYDVQLELPDLQKAPKRAWADWGPMCSCELGIGQTVRVTYTDAHSGEEAAYQITPPQLALNSPSSAAVRREYPLYVQVFDAPRSLSLRIFLDADGAARRVEAEECDPRVRFADVVFREKHATRMAG